MTDADVKDLKLAVQRVIARNEPVVPIPVGQAFRLVVEVETRVIAYRRLLDSAAKVIAVVSKWRTGSIDSVSAMQAISGVIDTWDGGKS